MTASRPRKLCLKLLQLIILTCLVTKLQVVCNMSRKTNQVQHDALQLMHKLPMLVWGSMPVPSIPNIQNYMAGGLLEQADVLLLDSGAVRPRYLLLLYYMD